MKLKISFKLSLLIITIVGVMCSSGIVLYASTANSYAPSDIVYAKLNRSNKVIDQTKIIQSLKVATTMKKGLGFPVRLSIPSIKVDAKIEYVGLTAGGAIGAPLGPTNAAWYDQGPKPGTIGSAVIDGHFGWKNGIPAVFDNLHSLQKGDKIFVLNDIGLTNTFVVREIKVFGENEDSSSVFVSSDGKAHLNLITCEGVWNKNTKSYSGRLVVFSDSEI